MKKFYMFTTSDAEDRRKELLDFVNKHNRKYASYRTVIEWIKGINYHYLMTSDGFEYADESVVDDPSCWGHGGLVDYDTKYHILVNGNLTLGEL